MITKELLSEVLKDKVRRVTVTGTLVSYGLHKWDDKHNPSDKQWGKIVSTLNIYELTDKCKKWAYIFGYEIASYKRIGNFQTKGLYTTVVHTTTRRVFEAEVITTTEPDTVFAACQWILDNKDK
jgi:hypothetical protein